MGIVLGILGILGKVLLCLLGILCVLVLLLLFYPIKYQAEAEWRDGVRVQGRLHWFWFLVRISASYEEEFQWKIRILGFDLMKIMEGKPGGRRKKSRNRPDGNSNHRQVREDAGKESHHGNAGAGEEGDGFSGGIQMIEEGEGSNEGIRMGEQEEGSNEGVQRGEQEENFQKSTETLWEKWEGRNPFKKLWHKFRQFFKACKRFIENLRRKAGYVKDMSSLLREDNSRELVCILKDNVIHLWRKLKPKVLRGHLLFGTGDPASTGEILGLFAILYAWYGRGIRIVPDFERKILEGELFARGGISIFTFLLVYVRVFRSDEWGCFKKEYDRLTAAIHGE